MGPIGPTPAPRPAGGGPPTETGESRAQGVRCGECSARAHACGGAPRGAGDAAEATTAADPAGAEVPKSGGTRVACAGATGVPAVAGGGTAPGGARKGDSRAAASATANSTATPSARGASEWPVKRRRTACADWRRTATLMRCRTWSACTARACPRGSEERARSCPKTRSAAGPQIPEGSNTMGTKVMPSLAHSRAVSRNMRLVAS